MIELSVYRRFLSALIATFVAVVPAPGSAPLQARFVGQMAFAITDGAVRDVISGLAADRVVVLAGPTAFGPVQIEPLQTPHARIGHYSYLVTWQGKRLYFSGDTEDASSLIAARNLDAAFVSPWLYRSVIRQVARIDAKRVVIYHHEPGQQIPGCAAGCVVPRQGDTITIP